ncbi:MAG: trypsin-like peptidase domain-containing protein [Acidobacteriota bacterium]
MQQSSSRSRSTATLFLVLASVGFGMILAGGIDLVPRTFADESGEPVRVAGIVGGLPNFADLSEAVSPAVVSIEAVKLEDARAVNPFELFMNPRRPNPNEQPERRRADSTGSGFVISGDGFVVTNHHVIEDATELNVLLEGRRYEAEVIGDDPATDLALLKIEADDELSYLELADSDAVRVGDWLMVIGSPLNLQNSVSVGVVSAKGRSINITPDSSLENFIQTDAAINFGNSGGPLVDLQGRVIGIATAINAGADNIGFAVPVNTLKRILPQLRDSGSVRRGYLGVQIDDLDFEEAEAFGLESPDGALVTKVTEDGPAIDSDIRHGDIILRVDDTVVRDNRDLIDYVSSLPPGRTVTLELLRAGDRIQSDITLGERPGVGRATPVRQTEDPDSIEWLGIEYQELDVRMRQRLGLPDRFAGLLVTSIEPTSPLYDRNVRRGDIIVDVNGEAVETSRELQQAVDGVASGGFLRLYVSRPAPGGEDVSSFFAIVRKP